jgi:hypothetical protein
MEHRQGFLAGQPAPKWVDNGRNPQLIDRLYNRLYKHAQVEQGAGPKFFWFCTPAGLVPEREIPDWAGLLEFQWTRPYHRPDRLQLRPRPVRQAPRIPGCRKFDQDVLDHCRSVAYYRYLNGLAKSGS